MEKLCSQAQTVRAYGAGQGKAILSLSQFHSKSPLDLFCVRPSASSRRDQASTAKRVPERGATSRLAAPTRSRGVCWRQRRRTGQPHGDWVPGRHVCRYSTAASVERLDLSELQSGGVNRFCLVNVTVRVRVWQRDHGLTRAQFHRSFAHFPSKVLHKRSRGLRHSQCLG